VVKAKIDTQILQKEETAINKLIDTNKIKVTDKLVVNYIQRKENITNQLEKLQTEGQKVSDLINQVKNNSVEQSSLLFKKLENATDAEKAKIVENLENRQENIQKTIEVKEGILQNAKTDEELKNLKDQIALQTEEKKNIFNNLLEMMKDKLVLMNENQKNRFNNYLKLRIAKLTKEGIEEIKQKINDGSVKIELENIISKIIQLDKPIVNQEKKEIIQERIELNKEIKEEKKGILDTAKQKIEELKDLKIKNLAPEEKQNIMNKAKELQQESIEKWKQLNEDKNKKLQELKDKMNSMQQPAKPILEQQKALQGINSSTNTQ
jgi:hypothetical protein